MKNLFKITLIFALPILFFSCSDEDDTPEPVNEEEIITTVNVTMRPEGTGETILLQSRDLDGDGPNDPVVTVSGNLMANTSYEGAIELLNETENPAEDVTLEILDEADEHQVFYLPGNGLNATFEYSDTDSNGNPLGVAFTMEAGAASSGTLNIVLRHEPKKPNNGTLSDAGGETDISVNFDLAIE